ncbi:MAG TPA: DUF2382 domain-containing protein [Nitrospiraceae bacterium]|nr:DUF2382 domain-containing protein [Nitrospiraceae bacterium]
MRNKQTGAKETVETVVVPVVQEDLNIEKRKIETGRVRLTKTVREREVVVEDPFMREEVEIERVSIDRFIEQPIEARYEGETLIIPVLEEVPVVVKRLKLKEELRITRQQIRTPHSQSVRLRSEEVTIERTDLRPASESPVSDSTRTESK